MGTTGNGDRSSYRRAIDTLDAPHPQQCRGHGGSRVPRRNHGACASVPNCLSRPNEGRILLAPNSVCGILIHRDHLGGREDLEVFCTLEILGPDKDHGDPQSIGFESSSNDLSRREITAHCIDSDRKCHVISGEVSITHDEGDRDRASNLTESESEAIRLRLRRGSCTSHTSCTPCGEPSPNCIADRYCAREQPTSRLQPCGCAPSSSTFFSSELPRQHLLVTAGKTSGSQPPCTPGSCCEIDPPSRRPPAAGLQNRTRFGRLFGQSVA